MTAPPST